MYTQIITIYLNMKVLFLNFKCLPITIIATIFMFDEVRRSTTIVYIFLYFRQ